MTISTHILRRGIEVAHHGMLAATEAGHPDDGHDARVSPIAVLIFFLTALVLIFGLFSVSLFSSISKPLTNDSTDRLHVRTPHAGAVHG